MAIGVLLLAPASALAHAERPSFFPDHTQGSVPQYQEDGPFKVVCKPGSGAGSSRAEIEAKVRDPETRAHNLNLLAICEDPDDNPNRGSEHIQAAVNAAQNGDRILILPGVYKEEPSRETADEGTSECQAMTVESGMFPSTGILPTDPKSAPTYQSHRTCPNAQNLIAIMGDSDPQPDPTQPPADDPDEPRSGDGSAGWCDDKCDIQIEGTGDTRDDVLIQGDKQKLNVIRADRADGIYLKNFTIEFSDFNNVYALETNGFRFDDIESRYTREYGFLSFTSDNGLYENLDAHHSGDSGIYPGSGPEREGEPCERGDSDTYGIEIRNVDSHDNTIGWSGTAGNRVYTHDSRFHHNSTGVTMDSFAGGHPGMPQDCSKWENNRIYSNNLDLFNDERDDYCRQPYIERDDDNKVCPTFQVPEGTGLLTAGGNLNTFGGNLFYDNWRQGTMLFHVPDAVRMESVNLNQQDTSWGNQTTGNRMGIDPNGREDPNGLDHWWDEQNGYEEFPEPPGNVTAAAVDAPQAGVLNCWEDNVAFGGRRPTSDPASLPTCDGQRAYRPPNPTKLATLVACAAWDPSEEETDSSLAGCDWFDNPTEPQPRSAAAPSPGGGSGTPPSGSAQAGGDDFQPDDDDADPSSGGGGGDGGSGSGAGGGTGAGDGSGELPFTGLALGVMLAAGLGLLTTGVYLRRGSSA